MRIKGLTVLRSGAWLFRAEDGEAQQESSEYLGTMSVKFSPFNTWYEVNSYWEGRFLERTVPGAFRRTIRDAKRADGRYSTKVLFNHGMDFHIGDKILGVPTEFAEREDSPELVVPLLDTSYNRDLLPGLREGGYGSSFMFEVIRESWDNEPEQSDYNPEGLPERTIREARVFEGGPVTFPASPTATAGMRSVALTDAFMQELAMRSPDRHGNLVQAYKAFRAATGTPDQQFTPTPDPSGSRRQVEQDTIQRDIALRRARLAVLRR